MHHIILVGTLPKGSLLTFNACVALLLLHGQGQEHFTPPRSPQPRWQRRTRPELRP